MGGRGNVSAGGARAAFAAAPINSFQAEALRLSQVFDLLTPAERKVITGFDDNQLSAIGLNPRTAFQLSAQGLANDQIDKLLAQANQTFDDYVVINPNSKGISGAYPFLETTGRQWNIVMQRIHPDLAKNNAAISDYLPMPDPSVTFGMTEPTLRWIKDGKVVSVFVDGLSLDQFTISLGLEITMPKGEMVTGKRLSRIFRDYKLYDTLPSSDVKLQIMQQSEQEKRVWDGAGVISRTLLKDLAVAQGIQGQTLRELLDEVDHGGRVEFTILNAQGQYKGHAMVSDSLAVDFLLPDDVKSDVKLTTGQTFVGINFVHGKPSMKLDVQSMVNLSPFFNNANLSTFLEAEGDLYLRSLDTGAMTDLLQRLQPHATVADVERWSLAEYYARGGDPTWFKTPIGTTINQHLDQLEFKTKGRMQMPIPGSRYYVMPDAVGRAANLDVNVPRGGIFIDRSTNTAFVNAEDWISLKDSPKGQGIRDLLGGADNDDALWLHPFRDSQDNANKLLVWRSPNEPGDYVLLQPTATSNISRFNTPEGPLQFRSGDSATLPERRDRTNKTYLGYVQEGDGSNLGKGQPYGIDIMDQAIRQEAKNAAVLGMYVNNLMVQKLVFGKTPDILPAPLENIVDASAKTGADLTRVKDWIFEQGSQFSEFGVPVPDAFQRRITVDRKDKTSGNVPATENHWVDQLLGVVQSHIDTTRTRAQALRANAQAPASFFNTVFQNPDDVYLGSAYNQSYGTALKRFEQQYGAGPAAHNAAQLAAEAFLSRFDEPKQRAILRGALVSSQMSERDASDAANWLQGHSGPDGRQRNSVASRTLDALTEVGLLGDLQNAQRTDPETGRSYFEAVVTPPPPRDEPRVTMLTLQHATRFELLRQGESPDTAPKHAITAAHKRIEANTRRNAYDGLELTIRYDNVRGERRAVAYTATGTAVGALPLDHPELKEGAKLRIRHAVSQGHNLRVIVE